GGYGAPQGYYQQPQAPMPPQGYYQQPQAPMPPQGYYQQPMGPGMHHGGWGQHGPRFLFGPLMVIGGLLKLLFFGLLLVGLLKLLGIWRGPRGPWGRCREHPDRQPDPAADQPAAGAPQARPGNEPPFTGATTSL
ncbi:MAG TPA: hypothetical protein PKA05_19875, partial [Roseiflexaceae bacterium]|nr:hypothetical protein [Roseiflexaceae bacterium]